jgi:lysozyme
MRSYSAAARQRLTEPWEEFVPYPYDDKVPKVHGRYPEYTFERPPRGTITIGFGHTDAAGNLKITRGMRLTREEAGELEAKDLAPCERAVNRALTVEVTQHQFDGIVDTYFNCPTAALAAIRLINAGRADQVPAKLLQYVHSKGEFMQGLVNRRNAEIAWFNHPDEAAPPPAPDPDIVFSPKGERSPPPKTMRQSKTGTASVSIFASALAYLVKQGNAVLDQAREIQGKLEELGLMEALGALVQRPEILLGAAVLALAVFIWFDRRHKLVNDHV